MSRPGFRLHCRPIAAALTIAVLSACNTQNSPVLPSSGLAPHANRAAVKMRPHDYSTNDLHAGGASSPALAYNLGNQPVGTATVNGNVNPQLPPGQGSLFYSAGTVGTIYYCINSSGFGRKEFENPNGAATNAATAPCAPLGASSTGFGARQDPLDFVGSDVTMASTEYPTYKTYREPASGTSQGDPFEIPVMGGAEVVGYRPKDFTGHVTGTVRLSTWTLCAITNGTISDWNDPAVTADNHGTSVTGGTSRPITYFFRADSAATTFYFTSFLAAKCTASWPAPYNTAPYEGSGHSAAWTYGATQVWAGPGSSTAPNPNFFGEQGNAGVLAGVQTTPFATGYLEASWAANANPAIGTAALQNGYNPKTGAIYFVANAKTIAAGIHPLTSSAISYGMGSDNVPLGSLRPDCQLDIPVSNLLKPRKGAYPILAISYLMFYGQSNVHYNDLYTLINYLYSPGAAKIQQSFGYAPLSPTIRTAVLNALNGTGNSTSRCMTP